MMVFVSILRRMKQTPGTMSLWTYKTILTMAAFMIITLSDFATAIECYDCTTKTGGDETCREFPEMTELKECEACYTRVWAYPARVQGVGGAMIKSMERGCAENEQEEERMKCQLQLGYRGHIRTNSYICTSTCTKNRCNDGYRKTELTDYRKKRPRDNSGSQPLSRYSRDPVF